MSSPPTFVSTSPNPNVNEPDDQKAIQDVGLKSAEPIIRSNDAMVGTLATLGGICILVLVVVGIISVARLCNRKGKKLKKTAGGMKTIPADVENQSDQSDTTKAIEMPVVNREVPTSTTLSVNDSNPCGTETPSSKKGPSIGKAASESVRNSAKQNYSQSTSRMSSQHLIEIPPSLTLTPVRELVAQYAGKKMTPQESKSSEKVGGNISLKQMKVQVVV